MATDTATLAQEINATKALVEQRLTKLKLPAIGVLSALELALGLMRRRQERYFKLVQIQRPIDERHAKARASERVARERPMAGGEKLLATYEEQIMAEARTELRRRVLDEDAQGADTITARVIERARDLEQARHRLAIESKEPAALRSGVTLEEILRMNELRAGLSTLSSVEIESLWRAELSLDPEKAQRIQDAGLVLLAERCNVMNARKTARESRSPSAAAADTERARRLLTKWQSLKAHLVHPDVETFDSEVRPQVLSLMRQVIGVDARALSTIDFERYAARYSTGVPLDEIEVRPDWPLRLVTPPHRSSLDARLEAKRPPAVPKRSTLAAPGAHGERAPVEHGGTPSESRVVRPGAQGVLGAKAGQTTGSTPVQPRPPTDQPARKPGRIIYTNVRRSAGAKGPERGANNALDLRGPERMRSTTMGPIIQGGGGAGSASKSVGIKGPRR